MNPIFQWMIAHTVGKALQRRCPKCQREQMVARDRAQATVPCKFCGEPLPPPPPKAKQS